MPFLKKTIDSYFLLKRFYNKLLAYAAIRNGFRNNRRVKQLF